MADELPPLVASLTGDDSGFSEMVDRAEGNIDRLKEALDELGARHDEATVGLDGNDDVTRKLDELDRKLDEYGRKRETAHVGVDGNDSDFEGPSTMLTAALSLGPALIPMLGVITAGVLGVGAAFGTAAVGVGGFAAVAVPEIEKIVKGGKDLTAAEQAAHNEIDGLKKSWDSFAASLRPAVIGDINVAVRTLAGLLPEIEPGIEAAARAFGDLERDASKALSDPFWTGFIKILDGQVGPAIDRLGKAGGHVLTGLVALFEDFLPLTDDVEKGLDRGAKAFEQWSKGLSGSSGLQSFISYIETEAPQVGRTLEDIATALGHVVTSMAPLGSISLGGLDDLAKLIDRIPAGDITHVSEAVAGLVVGMKALSAVRTVAPALEALASPAGLAAVAVGALGFGLYEAYEKSQPFHQAVDELASTVESYLLPAFRDLSGFWSNTLEPVLDRIANDALKGLTEGLHEVNGALESNRPQIEQLGHAFEDVADFITTKLLPVLGPVLENAIEVEGEKIKILIDVIGGLVTAFDDTANVVKGLPGDFESAWHAISSAVTTGISDAEAYFHAFANDAPGMLVSAGEAIISGLASGIEDGIGHFLGGALGKVESFIHAHKGPIEHDRVMLEPAGQAIMQGLADGIDHGTPKVGDALHKVTKLIDEGLTGGWTGEAAKLKDALSTPLQDALAEFEAHSKKLISAQESQVSKAQSALSSALKARASATKSLQESISAGADLSAFTTTDTAGNTVPSNIEAGLQSQIGPLKTFAKVLGELKKRGLSANLLAQVANLGPTEGTDVAEQILSGQDGSVGSLNATERQVQQYAGQAASLTEHAVYAKQIKSDRKDVHEQTEILKRVEKGIEQMARAIAKKTSVDLTVTVDKNGKVTVKESKDIDAAIRRLERTRGTSGSSGGSPVASGRFGAIRI